MTFSFQGLKTCGQLLRLLPSPSLSPSALFPLPPPLAPSLNSAPCPHRPFKMVGGLVTPQSERNPLTLMRKIVRRCVNRSLFVTSRLR